MTKRAIIYARVSTDDQRGNFSIPTQVESCIKYIQGKDYSLVGAQFVDAETGLDVAARPGSIPAFVDDFSSRELNRPSLDAALSYLESYGYDVVVVHALDRLARDPYIRQTIEIEFNRRGAKVEYVLGNYDETPEGEVRKDMEATFGKWENAKRVERCNRGKLGKAQKGLFVAGRVPYGYVMDAKAPGGLRVDEKQADVIRFIFQLYVEKNLSSRHIVKELKRIGAVPYLGGEEWGTSTIMRILHNSTYAGYFFYNKNKRIDRKRFSSREKSEWVRIETTPIIGPEIFNLATERLSYNREFARQQKKRFYLLSGMVRCQECDHAYMTETALAGRNRRLNDLVSYRHRMSEGHCLNRTISGRNLEIEVWEKIKALLMDPGTLRQGYFESLEQQQSTQARQRGLIEELRRTSIKLEQQKRNLNLAYTDPEIAMTKAEYLEQRKHIDDELAEVISRIEELVGQIGNIPTPAEFEDLETFSREVCNELAQAGDDLPPEDKRRILELLHVIVWVTKEGSVRLDGWFGNNEKVYNGGLSTLSRRYARQKQPLPGRV